MDCDNKKQIERVIEYLNGECINLRLSDTTGIEDSVLIVRRRGFWTVQEIYLDIAIRDRNLAIWNHKYASDSREKIGERLYLRTTCFD